MKIVSILVGLALLLFGRRLFWFFVAAVGFAAGLVLARDSLQLDSEWMVLAIALLSGLIGALLAVFVQKLAVGLAGFAAGGFLGAVLLKTFGVEDYAWIGFIVVGILGAILLLTVFEWALIAISALVGATLLSEGFSGTDYPALIFVAALVIGVVVQSLQLKRAREVKRPAPTAPAP